MNKKCAIIKPQNAPLYIELVVNKLNQKGIEADIFSWVDLESKNVFDKNEYGTVIIVDANNCPAFMPIMVEEYMKSGGNIVTLGGPPFVNEFYNINNQEVDVATLGKMMSQGSFDKNVLLQFDKLSDIEGFEKDTYNPDSKKYEGNAFLSIVNDGAVSSRCMRYYTDDFVINESFEKSIKIKEGHNVIGFYAKALRNTCTITIMLIQNNGDVFKTRITPSTNFKYFMLSKKDFVFSVNRFNPSERKYNSDVDFSDVCKIQFGHALSHAYSVAGEHAFFIDELSSANIALLNDKKITIDGLYPEYKFNPVTNAKTIKVYDKQAFITQAELEVPHELYSFPPRPQSTGIDKQRRFRFVPLIEAHDADGIRCGYVAYMLLNYSCSERKSKDNKSTVVAFTTSDYVFYKNGGADCVCDSINSLYNPVVLIEGGSNEYIYFEDDKIAAYGAVVMVRDLEEANNCQIKITVGDISRTYDINELCPVENEDGLDLRLVAFEDEPKESTVTVNLFHNGVECDILTHNITMYSSKPETDRAFAHIEKGTNEIYIGDKPVRFFGVNYMPTSNIGLETHEEFEHYVSSYAYDPDIIEEDFKRLRDVGLNAVSIFMHYSPSIMSNNILHIVSLCEKYGLYADMSIRPKANPFDFDEKEVKEMITKYRFNENDTIVAYDIAWERYLGTYNECYGNFNGRKSLDSDWRSFIINRYGSVENAESIWGYKVPRNADGEVIGVSDNMLRSDGEYNAMVAAYRRFADTIVAYTHVKAMQYIKSIDPNHMISPRTGDASTIPLVDPGIYGYDYKALSSSMDFMSPESYALTDNYSNMRQGVFTNVYSRYANPNNVIQWKEFGKSIWTGSSFTDNSISQEFQAEYYRRFFDMLIAGHTSGLYAWWWAGGYRIGENSDFGIINPDGSDRPVTKVFREYASKFINAPLLKKAEKQIYIDRDLHADGLLSMYKSIEHELFGAIESGVQVELVDGGSGKTSADVDLLEVGNSEAKGCVPKYIDAIITNVKVTIDGQKPVAVCNGDIIKASGDITIEVTALNSEKSRWLVGDDCGSVVLKSTADSDFEVYHPLTTDVSSLDFVTLSFKLDATKKGKLSFAFYAKDRTYFGERINLIIE